MEVSRTSGGDGGRSLCLAQIWSLEEKLDRVQVKCKELEEQNEELRSRYKVLDTVTRKNIKSLKPGLDERVQKVAELSEKQRSQRQSARQHSEQQEAELREQQELLRRQEAEKIQQGLELQEQEEELTLLKQQLQEAVADLEERLDRQREENQASKHSLMTETEKMMKRLEVSPSPPSPSVESDTAGKMRVLISAQQEKLCDLQAEVREFSHRLDTMQKDEEKFTQDRDDLRTDVKQLTEKLQKLRTDSGCCGIDLQDAEKSNAALRQDLASTSEACSQKTVGRSLQQAELQQWSSGRAELQRVMEEAIIVLRLILTGCPEHEVQWKTQRLLDLVHSVAPHKAGSAERGSTRNNVELRGLHPLGRVRR